MKTIRVTGKGQIKVHPDMTRIFITLKDRFMAYDEALSHSAEDTEILRDILAGLGFARSDLKTLSFEVEAKYEYEDRKSYRTRFDGYEYEHRMKVDFDSDNKRLGKILYALARGPVRAEFRIGYFVKDQEAAKNAMLASAVADAGKKAALLSQAAGVALKEIQSIDYSWGEVRFESRMMDCALPTDCDCALQRASFDMDIEPDDIEASDTVTVIWEIA